MEVVSGRAASLLRCNKITIAKRRFARADSGKQTCHHHNHPPHRGIITGPSTGSARVEIRRSVVANSDHQKRQVTGHQAPAVLRALRAAAAGKQPVSSREVWQQHATRPAQGSWPGGLGWEKKICRVMGERRKKTLACAVGMSRFDARYVGLQELTGRVKGVLEFRCKARLACKYTHHLTVSTCVLKHDLHLFSSVDSSGLLL